MWPSWRKLHHWGHTFEGDAVALVLSSFSFVPLTCHEESNLLQKQWIYLKRNFQGCETKSNLFFFVSRPSLVFHDSNGEPTTTANVYCFKASKGSSIPILSLVKVAIYGILPILSLCELFTCRTRPYGHFTFEPWMQRLSHDLTVPITVGVSFIMGRRHG